MRNFTMKSPEESITMTLKFGTSMKIRSFGKM